MDQPKSTSSPQGKDFRNTASFQGDVRSSAGALTAYAGPSEQALIIPRSMEDDLQQVQKAALTKQLITQSETINQGNPTDKKDKKAHRLTKKALKAYQAHQYKEAFQLAEAAVEADPQFALGQYALGLCLEIRGDFPASLNAYEKALKLDPLVTSVYFQLGNLASRLEMPEAAIRFYEIYIGFFPDEPGGYVNLSNVYRSTDRFNEAIAVLQMGVDKIPTAPALWNSLGTTAEDFGHLGEAEIFLNEALRVDPNFVRAYYNLGFLHSHSGSLEASLAYHEEALNRLPKNHPDTYEITHGLALVNLTLGRLEEGWKHWEVRLSPGFAHGALFSVDAKPWHGEDLKGKRIAVLAEQGLGDELMHAGALPDLIGDLDKQSNLMLAVDERLVPLFKERFPEAHVGPHELRSFQTRPVRLASWLDGDLKPDYFVPMGSLLQHYRKKVSDFPQTALLKSKDEAIEPWAKRLKEAGDGPYVGVCWRSMLMTMKRRRYYSPLEIWSSLLKRKDCTFVNLQYGDVDDDLKEMRDRFGIEMVNFAELDLKNDLVENAHLTSALDLVISAPTAAAALAGSVGTPAWIALPSPSYPTFGTKSYPFLPNSRCFWSETYGDWQATMSQMESALTAFVAENSHHEDGEKRVQGHAP